jgi:hypothetical protein
MVAVGLLFAMVAPKVPYRTVCETFQEKGFIPSRTSDRSHSQKPLAKVQNEGDWKSWSVTFLEKKNYIEDACN